MEKQNRVSGFWYLISGAAIGATLGVLLAPKKGSETRSELNEWSRRNGHKAQGVLSKIVRSIPTRVKIAAVAGGAKSGVSEAVSEGAERVKEFAS